MTLSNRKHSNYNYASIPKDAHRLYHDPLCIECGSYVIPYLDGSNLAHCSKHDRVPFVMVLETEVDKYREGLRETAKNLPAEIDMGPLGIDAEHEAYPYPDMGVCSVCGDPIETPSGECCKNCGHKWCTDDWKVNAEHDAKDFADLKQTQEDARF